MAEERSMTRLPKDHAYFTAVGRVAKEWALVENLLDGTICDLVKLPQSAGMCITAQLQGMLPRFRCLIALADILGASEASTKTIKELSNDSFGLGMRRNRIVHDVVLADKVSGVAVQLTVTADKKLVFKTALASEEDAHKLADEIRDYNEHCFEVLKPILSEIEAFQEKSRQGRA